MDCTYEDPNLSQTAQDRPPVPKEMMSSGHGVFLSGINANNGLTIPTHRTHSPVHGNSYKKRRCDENSPDSQSKENRTIIPTHQRRFLQLAACGHIFQTEDWKPKQESLYTPVTEDLLINTSHIEQISLSSGNFFTGNTEGVYCSTQAGHVIHLWRHDDTLRRLYISRSFLITDTQVLQSIKTQLSEV